MSHFGKKRSNKSGLQARCKRCRVEEVTLARYGITVEQKMEMLVSQKGTCALCGTTSWGKAGPQVDHCHTTKKIRGLLCVQCNVGLGNFKDSTTLLYKAVVYLERNHGSKKTQGRQEGGGHLVGFRTDSDRRPEGPPCGGPVHLRDSRQGDLL